MNNRKPRRFEETPAAISHSHKDEQNALQTAHAGVSGANITNHCSKNKPKADQTSTAALKETGLKEYSPSILSQAGVGLVH
jgi:hypothetical protein